jgi:DNA repair protein RadC
MKENHQATLDYLSNLLNESKLVDADEKKYWKDLLPVMTQDQIVRLFRILTLDNKEELIEFNKLFMINYE